MTTTLSRAALATAAALAMLSISDEASADETRYPASTRLNLGLGFGNSQLAARVGWSTDLWLSSHLGLGTHLGALIQGSVPRSAVTYSLGPEIAVRTTPVGSGFWLATISAGYAVDSVITTVPCVGDTCSFGTAHAWYKGAYSSLELGYIAEGRLFLGGIALRGEAAGWPGDAWDPTEAAITLNLVGGIKLR